MTVRRADGRDAQAIFDLLAAAGRALAEEGFHNWATPYSVDRIRADIITREVYVVEQNTALVATYTVGPTAVHPYVPPPWSQPAARAAYLNRMAVAPALQGRGLGSLCLADLARRVEQAGGGAIRCDVLAANRRLHAFYERHEFVRCGTRTHSGWRFVCYERIVP